MKKSRLIFLVVLWAGVLFADGVFAQNMDSVEGDRRALVDLYNAAGGDNWKNNSGWLSGNPSNNWHGVQVDGNGRVVKIKLNGSGFGRDGVNGGNNLRGSLPESIGNLTRVTYFNVKQNYLTGEIPSSIGNMYQLRELHLNGRDIDLEGTSRHHPGKPPGGSYASHRTNNFSGQLPSGIGNLTNLRVLELQGTGKDGDDGITGPLPESIGNLTNLEGLWLLFNSITYLPNSMENLTEMQNLGLAEQGRDRKALQGHGFPEWISNLTKLRRIWMQNNEGLGGELPDMSGLTELEIVLLDRNGLTGPIPKYFTDGTMPNLGMVQLAWNNLSGSFPEIKEPNRITAFTIEGNNISGEIHPSWGTSASRRIINFGVGWNNLEGEFPDMSHAYQLRYIRARNNNFTGPLPALHPDNRRLTNLWFQNNNFSGPVDPSIAEAIKNGRDSFGDFNISNNRFCEEELEDLVKAIAALSNGVSFNYGGQQDPICGGYASDTGGEGDGGSSGGDNDSDDGGEEGVLKAPGTLSPSHGSEDVSLTPTFEWSDIGADYYILHANRTDPAEMQIDVIVEGSSYTVSDLLDPEATYHWRVRGVKDGVEGKWSSVREFKTTGETEEEKKFTGRKPDPIAPEDRKKVKSKHLSFEWSDVNADEYILHISREDEEGNYYNYFLSDVEGIKINSTAYTLADETLPNRAHAWRVRGVKDGEVGEWSSISRFETDSELQRITGIDGERPLETAIHQNYPNPFNPSTQIEFTLSELQNVSLRVYDMAGRQVVVLVDGVKQAGHHSETFNADNLASGVYFYRFITESKAYTKQMALIK